MPVASKTTSREDIVLSFERGVFTIHRGDEHGTLPDIMRAARLRRYADSKAEKVLSKLLLTKYALPPMPPLPFSDPHQLEGVKWILSRNRSYLAHAPGAGKTLQAVVASFLTPGPGKVLFIVPPSLTLNWAREIGRWTEWTGEWATVGIVPVSAKRHRFFGDAHFIICPDSMLAKDWVQEYLKSHHWKFIAVDEASRFKEDTSERTKALFGGQTKTKVFTSLIRQARHTVLLDGSPMPNRPMELWAPTYAMAPDVIGFMGKHEFGMRYCGAKPNDRGEWVYKYSANESELKQRLHKDFMHVVTESQLSHPERRRKMLIMNVDPRSHEHKAWEQANLAKIKFDGLTDETMGQGDLARFRKELGLRKVPWVTNYTSQRLKDKDESVLLFAWHREVVLQLAQNLAEWDPVIVMGGTKNSEREKGFIDFQAGRKKLIIGNIAAMGRGHNLQRADRNIFGEFSWSDETNTQCEKRTSRKGNDKLFVPCDYIVAPKSMDEMVLTSVFTKAARVKRIIG